MDVIIVVHTEFGFVHAKEVIPDKKATEGVSKGVPNLIKVADKHGAKATFAVMPRWLMPSRRVSVTKSGCISTPGGKSSGRGVSPSTLATDTSGSTAISHPPPRC